MSEDDKQEQQRRQVGERVQHARESLGWSQMALARKANVSENTVGSIENGKRRTQPEKLRRVLDALGLPPAGDVSRLNLETVPADGQVFLTVAAARLVAIQDENKRARLLARVYPFFVVDDIDELLA